MNDTKKASSTDLIKKGLSQCVKNRYIKHKIILS